MKKFVLLIVMGLIFSDGLFAQAKQRKVLLQQIAALKIYIDYAQKGYSTVKKGLNFIGDVKKGELNLHSDYFNSLKKVNPKIKKYYRVADIVSLQIKIIKGYKNTVDEVKSNDLFYGDELDYIERAFDRLLADCNDTLEQLLSVTLDAKLEMKDDQRIERIDQLYNAMLDNYRFSQTFSKEALVLSLSKSHERSDSKSAVKLYGFLKLNNYEKDVFYGINHSDAN